MYDDDDGGADNNYARGVGVGDGDHVCDVDANYGGRFLMN